MNLYIQLTRNTGTQKDHDLVENYGKSLLSSHHGRDVVSEVDQFKARVACYRISDQIDHNIADAW